MIKSEHFLKQLGQFLISLGPLGLLLVAFLDSAGIPIVGGVDALVITFAVEEPKQAYWAASYAVLGSLVGSLLLFVIARKGGEIFLAKHISKRRGARLHKWFQRYGLITVFVPALLPIPLPLKIPVFCAGALGVTWPSFIGVILSSRAIRYFALAYLGRHYGFDTFRFIKSHGPAVAAIAGGLVLASFLLLRLNGRGGPPKSKNDKAPAAISK